MLPLRLYLTWENYFQSLEHNHFMNTTSKAIEKVFQDKYKGQSSSLAII